ncbi:MAG: hypothetical protein C0494_05970 [Sphingobium sp.]|nr:hypothetical protein [Sphingobium sp.]
MGFMLREDLSFGLYGERAIFMDIAQDRYFCISSELNGAFLALQQGAALNDADVQRLLQARIIIASTTPGKIAAVKVPRALYSMAATPPALSFDSLSLWTAAERIWVTGLLSLRPLATFVDRAAAAELHERSSKYDAEIGEMVAHFRASNRLFQEQGRCLSNSIALRRRLQRYGHRATLVFGVRLFPFEAHCWLQRGVTVLNDHHEHVAQFTPVLAA